MLEKGIIDRISGGVSMLTIALGRGLSVFENRVYDPAVNVGIPNTFLRGSEVLFEDLETEVIDRGLNEGVPAAATGLYHHVKKLQTGVLSYNIIYIIMIFLSLIIVFVALQMYGGM